MANNLLLLFFLVFSGTIQLGSTLPEQQSYSPPTPSQINSNSVLVALLDSHYTELAELVEKALLLPTLEEAVYSHNITIFAPQNEALERDLDPEFKRFLLEPGNINSLQTLLLHHILPTKLTQGEWPTEPTKSARHPALSNDHIEFSCSFSSNHSGSTNNYVGSVKVVYPDSILRPDGIIHGIEKVLIPKSVEHAFNNRRSLRSISAVKPEGAPEIDPRSHKLLSKKMANSVPIDAHAPSKLSIYEAMAPAPSLAPAPAPGPGGSHHHFDGERQVKDFIQTLLLYGGYNEMADILVNLTNLATEMGKLISEGYVLTVLAPNDEAMAKLTAEQLSEPGAPEQIIYYHIVPEYQTEESMYNAVRRFGKVAYDTLHVPHKILAKEADGSVKFGDGEAAAYLFDPDIYTDGRISVQGIDGVLFPPEEKKKEVKIANQNVKNFNKPRRGKLLEVACGLLGAFGQDSQFITCREK
ncbi:Fasciclin-like arabinogalactan protein 17 [Abeliophyllum distichum]|uniref:Fasciclin-like arabinogalactan protein 17 n=1 Tax=Abeliophyllum distichum TaxID=126358 RepID=A0ABD1UM89_9LAMI